MNESWGSWIIKMESSGVSSNFLDVDESISFPVPANYSRNLIEFSWLWVSCCTDRNLVPNSPRLIFPKIVSSWVFGGSTPTSVILTGFECKWRTDAAKRRWTVTGVVDGITLVCDASAYGDVMIDVVVWFAFFLVNVVRNCWTIVRRMIEGVSEWVSEGTEKIPKNQRQIFQT